MKPIAEHSFIIKAIRRLYQVRTRQDSFMDKPSLLQARKFGARRNSEKERSVQKLKDIRIKERESKTYEPANSSKKVKGGLKSQ